MRLFIATSLPAEIQPALTVLLRELAEAERAGQAKVKWVDPQQCHLTLKFLGECDEKRQNEFSQALDRVVRGVSPFPVALSGLGSFPPAGAPRVLWLGVRTGGDTLSQLAAQVDAVFEPLGFAKESRPFVPHFTLGRVKSSKRPDLLRSLLARTRSDALGTFTVGSVGLIRSVLSPSGPTYTLLHSAPLR
jgi:2'-5' RNA ligase